MPDIAKCTNEDCPKKEQCLRYTAPADEYQTYADFQYTEEGCDFFMPNK